MSSCGTLTVETPFSAADVSISGCTIVSSTVAPGEQAYARVTVRNDNNTSASANVAVKLDGTTVSTMTFTVGANSQITDATAFTAPATDGTYQISSTLSNAQMAAPMSAPRARGGESSGSLSGLFSTSGCLGCGGGQNAFARTFGAWR